MSEKQPSVKKLFVERLTREGRRDEWRQAVRDAQRETGLQYGAAAWTAMRRLGYLDADNERALYAEWQASLKAKEQAVVEQQVEQKLDAARLDMSFEQALDSLPATADPRAEFEWIKGHVAMCRKSRMADDAPVVITADDVLCASHGAAPSRAAAIALQNFASAPNEFVKQMASFVKRTESSDPVKDEFIADENLAEVERLLKEMSNGTGSKCPHCGKLTY